MRAIPAILLGAVLAACGHSDPPREEGEWRARGDDPCAPYDLVIERRDGSSTTITDGTIPPDVSAPPRPTRGLSIDYQHEAPKQVAWMGDEILGAAHYAWSAPADPRGRLVFPIPCGATVASVDRGAADGANLVVDVTLRALPDLDVAAPLAVHANLVAEDGSRATLVYDGQLVPRAILRAQLAGGALAADPAAPAYAKGSHAATAISYPAKTAGAPLAQAALVALVSYTTSDDGTCGPYGADTTATRLRMDATVTVYATRTAEVVATRTFEGAHARCPKTIEVVTGDGADTALANVLGDAPERAVTQWLASL